MGFNKRYLDKDRIISSFKQEGALGVTNLYRADAVIIESRCPICHYIDKIMSKNESIEYKHNLIEVYMSQLLEGLYTSKL
tara:strand:- start:118 stop:357 length:240 start_codon:yes stop_codon:yes gene_type:complete